MKRIVSLIVICLLGISSISSQELKCNIIVNSDQIKGTNKHVFTTLQKSLNEFVNNRQWTDLQYKTNEKIECSFIIVVNEQSETSFKSTIQIQARRPVFNSAYYTPIFSFKDDNFNFDYLEMTQLEFTEGQFGTNLTAVIAYYCYMIIGFDCDSYSKLGGTPYFMKAEGIVNTAQSQQNEKGWKAFEDDRNRYALVNDILDENLKPFREFYYDYHRLGLDVMYENVANGTSKISSSIEALRDVSRIRTSSVVISSFIETKSDEIINIFSKAPSNEKHNVYDLMMDINPSLSGKFEPLKN